MSITEKQERVRTNSSEPPEFHHWFYLTIKSLVVLLVQRNNRPSTLKGIY